MQPFFSFWLVDDARLHSASTYVHCKAGKSRSVTVVLGYLIHANAWTLKTSYAYVAEKRRGISPNIGFVAELMQFEESELGLKATSGCQPPGAAAAVAATMTRRLAWRSNRRRIRARDVTSMEESRCRPHGRRMMMILDASPRKMRDMSPRRVIKQWGIVKPRAASDVIISPRLGKTWQIKWG